MSMPLHMAGNYFRKPQIALMHINDSYTINHDRQCSSIRNITIEPKNHILRDSLGPVVGRQQKPEIRACAERIFCETNRLICGLPTDTCDDRKFGTTQIHGCFARDFDEILSFLGR